MRESFFVCEIEYNYVGFDISIEKIYPIINGLDDTLSTWYETYSTSEIQLEMTLKKDSTANENNILNCCQIMVSLADSV